MLICMHISQNNEPIHFIFFCHLHYPYDKMFRIEFLSGIVHGPHRFCNCHGNAFYGLTFTASIRRKQRSEKGKSKSATGINKLTEIVQRLSNRSNYTMRKKKTV